MTNRIFQNKLKLSKQDALIIYAWCHYPWEPIKLLDSNHVVAFIISFVIYEEEG